MTASLRSNLDTLSSFVLSSAPWFACIRHLVVFTEGVFGEISCLVQWLERFFSQHCYSCFWACFVLQLCLAPHSDAPLNQLTTTRLSPRISVMDRPPVSFTSQSSGGNFLSFAPSCLLFCLLLQPTISLSPAWPFPILLATSNAT